MGEAKVSESLQLILLYLPTAGGNYLHSKMAMMTTKIFGDYRSRSKVWLWLWQKWWRWRWQWRVENKATLVRVNYHYYGFCWRRQFPCGHLTTDCPQIKRAPQLFPSNGLLTIFTGRFYIYSLYLKNPRSTFFGKEIYFSLILYYIQNQQYRIYIIHDHSFKESGYPRSPFSVIFGHLTTNCLQLRRASNLFPSNRLTISSFTRWFFIYSLELLGPSGARHLAGNPWGLFTSYFEPFGCSSRVTHADKSSSS